MQIEEKNIEAIADYFNAGCKKDTMQKVGIETECFVVDKHQKPISYEKLKHIMMMQLKDGDTVTEEEGNFLGYYNKDFAVSLEPAAQLEISIMPQTDLRQTQRILGEFRKDYAKALSQDGYTMVNTGYHPSCRAEMLTLIPKKRYEYMNTYFAHSGSRGYQMMRATASTQVSVDYFSEEDFVTKYRLACALVPVLSLITDNSPVYEGQRSERFLTRSFVWQDVDKDRCLVPECTFDENFGFKAYAEYIYYKPPILVKEGNHTFVTGDKTIAEWYKDRVITAKETEHLISMFFPDVRLKQYIEIRPADSLPEDLTLAYAAMVRAIFYKSQILKELTDYLAVSDKNEIGIAKNNLMENGYAGEIYGKPVTEVTDKIFNLIEAYADSEEKRYVKPLAALAAGRITPSEYLWSNGYE